jgi:hypothetical protein
MAVQSHFNSVAFKDEKIYFSPVHLLELKHKTFPIHEIQPRATEYNEFCGHMGEFKND